MHSLLGLYLALVVTASVAIWLAILVVYASRQRDGIHSSLLLPLLFGTAAVVPTAIGVIEGVDVLTEVSVDQLRASWTLAALFALIGSISWMAAMSRGGVRVVRHRAIVVILLAYWSVGMTSDALNGHSGGPRSVVLVPVAILAAATVFPDGATVRRAFVIAGSSVCAASLAFAMFDYARSHTQPTRILPDPLTERLTGITAHPNVLGSVAALTILMSAATPGRYRIAAVPLAAAALLLSESRGAWLGLAAGGLLLAAGSRFGRARSRRTLVALGSMMGFSGIAWMLTAAVASSDLQTFGRRTEIWDFVLASWRDSPYYGFGPSVWDELAARELLPTYVGSAHNQAFESLFTLGVLGGALLLLLIIAWARLGFAHARDGDWLPISLFAAMGVLSFFEETVAIWSLSVTVWVLLSAIFAADDPLLERRSLRGFAPHGAIEVPIR